MIIRVVCPTQGTRRIEVSEHESMSKFRNKAREAFNLSGDSWKICLNRNGTNELPEGRTHCSTHLKHGAMVFLAGDDVRIRSSNEAMDVDRHAAAPSKNSVPDSTADVDAKTRSSLNGSTTNESTTRLLNVVEDEVDQILEGMDGRIYRERNEQLCRHGKSGKCIHCVPLEPYDEEYLKHCDPPIKLMSFHAYLRKLKGGADKGKFVSLENISCRIKDNCKGHLPWPEGICTKCQPNALTLAAQKYRHVDYVQFENPALMERFLDYWRSTGHQRIGILYGRYSHFENAPLGIQAVVSAIYEPPQNSTPNSCELLVDEKEARVREVAGKLGVQPVGWIFTDLVAENLEKGSVRHYRGTMDSFFLSAQECITAAHFQNRFPNPCRLSPDGHFGSKFVTVVVTGNSANEIHFEAYQVSNQCMALVRDGCLVPTFDAPELGYIKESSNDQYVPDVFYTEKDKYGNEIKRLGRPLPVDYLICDMPVAFPLSPSFTFSFPADLQHKFPIENRAETGDIQDFNAFARYVRQFPEQRFLEGCSNFHLLLFMATCEILPLHTSFESLLTCVRQKDAARLSAWWEGEEWQTVLQLLEHVDESSGPSFSANAGSPAPDGVGGWAAPSASGLQPNAGGGGGGGGGGGLEAGSGPASSWACKYCTYMNAGGQTCEMCGLPAQ